MSTALSTLTSSLAQKYGMGDGGDLSATLKATCFKGSVQVSDAQMTALLVVAQQHGLNPFTKEIYAFPDKGGIVPVVSIGGWARIINKHPMMDGMDFQQDAESCTCVIYRKDRSHPTRVTEWMSECKRGTQPWQSHPKRMLRHKALIQCARVAFGFAGIYDEDEAGRIVEAVSGEQDNKRGPKSINPETGELEPVVFDVVAALNAVEYCKTLEALAGVWQVQGKAATDAKDRGGWKALQAAVQARRADLEAAERQAATPDADGVIDVEAKEGAAA